MNSLQLITIFFIIFNSKGKNIEFIYTTFGGRSKLLDSNSKFELSSKITKYSNFTFNTKKNINILRIEEEEKLLIKLTVINRGGMEILPFLFEGKNLEYAEKISSIHFNATYFKRKYSEKFENIFILEKTTFEDM